MDKLRQLIGAIDGWQRRHRWAGVPYAVNKKFSDDNANLQVLALAWYGFTAIFPLLLVVITVLGFVGQASLGTTFLTTLHKFPVVGSNFNPQNPSSLHGSTVGLVIGLIGLIYGAQGVTQSAQQAMVTVWNIPQTKTTGFLPRLGRSLAGLVIIGGTFLVNAALSTYVTGGTSNYAIRVPVRAARSVARRGHRWGRVHRADHRGDRVAHPHAEERLQHLRHVRHGHRHRGHLAAAGQGVHLRGRAEPGAVPVALPAGAAPGWRADRRRPAGADRPGARPAAPRRPGHRGRFRRGRRRPGRRRRGQACPRVLTTGASGQ